jgi:hypothetical protein
MLTGPELPARHPKSSPDDLITRDEVLTGLPAERLRAGSVAASRRLAALRPSWATLLEVQRDGELQRFDLELSGGQVLLRPDGAACRVTIIPSAGAAV